MQEMERQRSTRPEAIFYYNFVRLPHFITYAHLYTYIDIFFNCLISSSLLLYLYLSLYFCFNRRYFCPACLHLKKSCWLEVFFSFSFSFFLKLFLWRDIMMQLIANEICFLSVYAVRIRKAEKINYQKRKTII